MGLFDSIKNLFRDPLLEEIVSAHGLVRDESSPLKLWAGHAMNRQVSLEQGWDKKMWFLTAGDLKDEDEEDSVYLERLDPENPPEEIDPDEKLDRFPGLAGTSLAKQYLLAGLPESDDYSILELPAVRDLLPRFSPAVKVVDLYFNRRAVVIGFRRDQLDRSGFDRDLALALDLVKAQGG